MESVLSLVLVGHDGGEAGESSAWEMISSGIWGMMVERLERLGHGNQCPVESVLSLVLVGHDGGEAGESRAWEMSVIYSGICPIFGVGGA